MFGDGGIVGERGVVRGAMRVQDFLEAEALRCLGHTDAVSRKRRRNTVTAQTFQCVGRRDDGQGAIRRCERCNGGGNRVGADERARGVMDQHEARPCRDKALETFAHRCLARVAAVDRWGQVKAFDCRFVKRTMLGADDDLNSLDGGVLCECHD